jgi:predicted lysophospholipase L1 biosynthesis ABC-type transport system permease subunit
MPFWLPLLLRHWRECAIAGVIVVSLFAMRYMTNRAYYQGQEQGRRTMAADLEKQKEREWAARESEIAKAQADAKTAIDKISAERSALARVREQADQQFRAQLISIRARAQEASLHVSEILPDDLPDSIRRQLAVNRSGEQ